MKKFINLLMLLLASFNTLAASNSNPGLYYGQIPTAAQWNSYFSTKLDYSPGAANAIPYWDASGNLLSAPASGSCTSVANVFTCVNTTTTNLAGGNIGFIPYQSAPNTTLFVTGNTTTTPQFLTSTGTGAAATAPTLTGSTGTGNVVLASNLIGRNVIIDGGFTINQRAYVSAATLAAGTYGHDRWKAGAGGGDYSFTQLASNTQITIAANKTLIQVVEDKNVQGSSYILSWSGTCTGRYAVNSATPAGSYVASPVIITGQTAGTTMSVEFGGGASSCTLGTVQLEQAASGQASPTGFERRPYGYELELSQRYFYAESSASNANTVFFNGEIYNSTLALGVIRLPVTMRVNPIFTASGTYQVSVGATNYAGTWAQNQTSVQSVTIQATITGATAGQACRFTATAADVRLKFEAEL